MNLVAVPPDKAQQAWHLAEKHVLAAIDGSGFAEVSDIQMQVMLGEALLWLAAEGTSVIGAGVTRLIDVGGKKSCEIFAWGAEDQQKCAPLLKTIEKYAKNEGCASMRLSGRRGWARQLPDYRLVAVILEKELP